MDTETLRRMFVYEPDTGMLRRVVGGRKPYPWSGIGKDRRYLRATVAGKCEYLHRLVWQYHKGSVPHMIDHIDGNPRNNRIENLRECTAAQNQYNTPRKANNKSGAKGVVFHAPCTGKPWHAKIVVDGKVRSLGYYKTVEEAAAAYAAGAEKFAKEFARKD